MPQLHFYVPEEIATKVRKKAEDSKMSISRYLAGVIKRDVGEGWPAGYFDRICGSWEGKFPVPVREAPDLWSPLLSCLQDGNYG